MRQTFRVDEADTASLNANQVRRLAEYLKPYRKQVAVTVLFMFVATITELSGPYLLQRAIDVYLPAKRLDGLVGLAALYAVFIGVGYVCNHKKILLANTTGQQALLDLRTKLFSHVQSLSSDYFDNHSAGRIIVRIVNDVNTLNQLFTNGIVNIITELSMLAVATVMMLLIHPRLALMTFATVPVFMIALFITRNTIKGQWRRVRRKLSNLNAYIHENIVGMKVIQAYARQRENDRVFHSVIDDVFASWMAAIRLNSAFAPAVEFISIVGTVVIFWYGAQLLAIDGVTVGVVIAFTVYLRRFWQPVITLSNFYNQLLVAMASSERIFELMDVQPTIREEPHPVPVPRMRGEVEFDSVTFGYDPDEAVLKEVSFHVKPGETIALVGPTGSGKTSIVNLITRFYIAQGGSVRIDGIDIRKIAEESLRNGVGIMLQDPFIFSGTILDNIRYGRQDASEEQARQVAQAVHAHSFIAKTDKGYNTEVNERGSRLSIGQRQLICFARVLLADPAILILDEATASIDTNTEILLQKAIAKLLKGRTSFVIAHRLSTIRNADRIMVVQQGRIVECGTHQELMKRHGVYHSLYSVQYQHLDVV